jgi:hypothetical protein
MATPKKKRYSQIVCSRRALYKQGLYKRLNSKVMPWNSEVFPDSVSIEKRWFASEYVDTHRQCWYCFFWPQLIGFVPNLFSSIKFRELCFNCYGEFGGQLKKILKKRYKR